MNKGRRSFIKKLSATIGALFALPFIGFFKKQEHTIDMGKITTTCGSVIPEGAIIQTSYKGDRKSGRDGCADSDPSELLCVLQDSSEIQAALEVCSSHWTAPQIVQCDQGALVLPMHQP